MSELKGQLLGILLVLALFGAVATVMSKVMQDTTTKISQQVSDFSIPEPSN